MSIHIGEQTAPIDFLMCLQNEVRDVCTFVTIVLLNEALGPQQLGRADDLDTCAENVRWPSVVDPVVSDRDDAVGRSKNYIDVVHTAVDLGDPKLIFHRDGVIQSLK